jgi:hypothetical protein
MGWYDTDITRRQLYQLHLPCSSARESQSLRGQAAETQWVVRSLEDCPKIWRILEMVDAHTIL